MSSSRFVANDFGQLVDRDPADHAIILIHDGHGLQVEAQCKFEHFFLVRVRSDACRQLLHDRVDERLAIVQQEITKFEPAAEAPLLVDNIDFVELLDLRRLATDHARGRADIPVIQHSDELVTHDAAGRVLLELEAIPEFVGRIHRRQHVLERILRQVEQKIDRIVLLQNVGHLGDAFYAGFLHQRGAQLLADTRQHGAGSISRQQGIQRASTSQRQVDEQVGNVGGRVTLDKCEGPGAVLIPERLVNIVEPFAVEFPDALAPVLGRFGQWLNIVFFVGHPISRLNPDCVLPRRGHATATRQKARLQSSPARDFRTVIV